MAPTRVPTQTEYTVQNMENASFDKSLNILMREIVGFDGQSIQRMLADNLQMKHVESGGYDYFCFAAPGVAANEAKWMIFRLDGDTNKMFADADANFDNVATDPTLLTYGYT